LVVPHAISFAFLIVHDQAGMNFLYIFGYEPELLGA
jgi:hypothetical protein